MDKILLANSLLDQVERLFLYGEVGLAGLHALDIPVGKWAPKYDKYKPFFIKLFEKAAEKGVTYTLPTQFLVSKEVEFVPEPEEEKKEEVADATPIKKSSEADNSVDESGIEPLPEYKPFVWKPTTWQDQVLHEGKAEKVTYDQECQAKVDEIRLRVERRLENKERVRKGLKTLEEEEAEQQTHNASVQEASQQQEANETAEGAG